MKNSKVIVTGGCGYIGSHTIIDLIEHGFDVVSIDNFSRSSPEALNYIREITGKNIVNYDIDLCDAAATSEVFHAITDVVSVIHFAALKSVPESIGSPEMYYRNNLVSLINVLNSLQSQRIKNFVFSSSCSVYGEIRELPVSESSSLSGAKSPYASTKIMGEKVVSDICRSHQINAICLRYFNPVGAHSSGLIGEMPFLKPDNLIPVITQTGIGKRDCLTVFGGDLPTRDGSCIRDYVHVMDIASAHVMALEYLLRHNDVFEVINLGTGSGVSVFEVIRTFEEVSGQKLKYRVAQPREGDIVEIYSDPAKAREFLGWKAKYDVVDMIGSAWKWELALSRRTPARGPG